MPTWLIAMLIASFSCLIGIVVGFILGKKS